MTDIGPLNCPRCGSTENKPAMKDDEPAKKCKDCGKLIEYEEFIPLE